jgi:hypothetical protein
MGSSWGPVPERWVHTGMLGPSAIPDWGEPRVWMGGHYVMAYIRGF